jgi:AraC-like DNA-binding protein
MPRHHHNEGYATVVLSGSITEVSFAGRSYAEAGHVLLHGRFDCHLDEATSKRPLQILRLPWRHDAVEGRFCVTDPDALVRLAESDPNCASTLLHENLRAVAPRDRYWVDDLADALRDDPGLRLGEWAESRGLRPDTVSYVFGREFGVSPKRFRMECHARLAWREVMRSTTSLTDIAHKLGFADLAHLSRSIHALTGRCPRDWRVTASVH